MARARLFAATLPLVMSGAALAEEAPSQARLRADVEHLVAFGTRHTLSSQDDPKRGIGAARRWAEAELRNAGKACGNCLEIVLPEKMVQGERVPVPTRLVDVVAIQRGSVRPNEVVIVQGHIDSRVSDPLNATSDAPGANDDGSGTALVLEAARVLSKKKYPATIVYAVLSGEEQGLLGGQLLADYAKARGWTVKAVLNNDIVGNSRSLGSSADEDHVRVFSEGPRADGDDKLRAAARRFGGENDSPSRNLSRFVARVAGEDRQGIEVREIWRTDRMGRGGDHIPFLDAGIPAIRFSVGIEDYTHQHQDLRVENGVTYGDTIEFMDFAYLAKVTALNVSALDQLARAPMPPEPTVDGAVKNSTSVCWKHLPGASAYHIWQRRTDQSGWDLTPATRFEVPVEQVANDAKATAGDVTYCREFEGVRADDWLFGVSSVAADASESPVASAVPGGAFKPLH